jgi:hypothetical protein
LRGVELQQGSKRCFLAGEVLIEGLGRYPRAENDLDSRGVGITTLGDNRGKGSKDSIALGLRAW